MSLPPRHLAEPALRAFFGVAAAWRLTEREQMDLLGLRTRSALHRWRAGGPTGFTRDTLERISYVLGIFHSLNTLFPEPARADTWIRAPNAAPLFGGQSALERMTAGNVGDLYVVRHYLDAQRW